MAERINLSRFKNINLPPVKNVAKTTAAITLLLSTTACSLNEYTIGPFCIVPLVTVVPLVITRAIIANHISKGGGGGSNSPPGDSGGWNS